MGTSKLWEAVAEWQVVGTSSYECRELLETDLTQQAFKKGLI